MMLEILYFSRDSHILLEIQFISCIIETEIGWKAENVILFS